MMYVLPGMGADHRMYPAPWSSLPECTLIDWPSYLGERTLAETAQAVVREHSLQQSAWLVGSSLGGMVACEISRILPSRGIILVGSAQSKDEVSPLLRWLAPLIDLAPLKLVMQLAGKAPSELAKMFMDSDPAFVRAMCRAIVQWEGLDSPTTELHRLHGRRDRVIPMPPGVECVLDGGHLIAMTHAPECVAFIRSIIHAELGPNH